jgi:hypothetical protein
VVEALQQLHLLHVRGRQLGRHAPVAEHLHSDVLRGRREGDARDVARSRHRAKAASDGARRPRRARVGCMPTECVRVAARRRGGAAVALRGCEKQAGANHGRPVQARRTARGAAPRCDSAPGRRARSCRRRRGACR